MHHNAEDFFFVYCPVGGQLLSLLLFLRWFGNGPFGGWVLLSFSDSRMAQIFFDVDQVSYLLM